MARWRQVTRHFARGTRDRAGKFNTHDCASALLALNRQRAAMDFAQAPHNRQAETAPVARAVCDQIACKRRLC